MRAMQTTVNFSQLSASGEDAADFALLACFLVDGGVFFVFF